MQNKLKKIYNKYNVHVLNLSFNSIGKIVSYLKQKSISFFFIYVLVLSSILIHFFDK